MEELEKTYLAKSLPDNLSSYESYEITDSYLPASAPHPNLRLRKKGDSYELVKKTPVVEGDASHQIEETIKLNQNEYEAISQLPAKKVSKIRYLVPHNGLTAEFDVFQGNLSGLVLVDFEFTNKEEKDAFSMPDFCLADVTQEEFVAGGMLCGKSYQDIEQELSGFSYQQLS